MTRPWNPDEPSREPAYRAAHREIHDRLANQDGCITFLLVELRALQKRVTKLEQRNDTLDQVLTEFPPLIKHFADTRDLFADAVTALGRVSKAADATLSQANPDLHQNFENLQRPLKQLGKASPYLIGALKLLFTAPFSIENVPKVVRGDYINVSLNVDLTLSAIDNGLLSGTGVSGMLRALEQAWGRDPETMIPDVRFTPNAHNVPGGPLVERGE